MKYLKEVDLVSSNIFGEEKCQFCEESRCVLYLLNECIRKKVESEFKKIVIKIWPIGKLPNQSNLNYLPDRMSGVLNIEIEYCLDGYYGLDELSCRGLEVVRILKSQLKKIPVEFKVDRFTLLDIIEDLSERELVYKKELGPWVKNSSNKQSVRLWVGYNASKILLGMIVKENETGDKYKKIFAEFEPNQEPVLYELGKLRFVDDCHLIYHPLSYYQDIAVSLN